MSHRSHLSHLIPPSLCACIALVGAALAAEEPQGNLAAFTATLRIEAGAPVTEKVLVKKLKARAKKLGLDARLEPGEKDDLKLTLLLFHDVEGQARAGLEKLIQTPALELRKVHPQNDSLVAKVEAGDHIVPGYALHDWEDRNDETGEVTIRKLLLAKRNPVEGQHVKRAWPDQGRAGVINVQLTDDGGALMKQLTAPMEKGRDRLAIILDGVVKSAPVVQDTLSNNFIIQGIVDDERKALAAALTSPVGAKLAVEDFRAAKNAAP